MTDPMNVDDGRVRPTSFLALCEEDATGILRRFDVHSAAMTRQPGSPDRDFLDVRTHGFARVAVCVPPVRVADPAFNAEAHLEQLEAVHRAGAHYAALPRARV